MSASPPAVSAPVVNSKRPFDDESSSSGPTDQPDAKRPALDKTEKEQSPSATTATAAESLPSEVASKEVNGTSDEKKPDASLQLESDDLPGQSTNKEGNTIVSEAVEPITTATESTAAPVQAASQQDETTFLHMRAVISCAEAATVIGKGGENVSQIRRHSGAKCTISDYSRGAVERVLTVNGPVDAVAKGFGLIIRTLNNEALEAASTSQSKTYPLRLLIPHILIGSIIGKGGVRIREIQEASGARLNASDSCLPQSTERSLVVLGVADAVHIATYYVGQTLVEQLTERFGGPAASAYATRSGGPAGVGLGGMQVAPYVPLAAGGQYGHADQYRRPHPHAHRGQIGPYGGDYMHGGMGGPVSVHPQAPQHHHPHHHQQHHQVQSHAGLHYGGAPQVATGYSGAAVGPQHMPQVGAHPQGGQGHMGQPGASMQGAAVPGQPLTQQIFIPNDMVGAIIGKGGAKINEIRQVSGSVIKINEPQDNNNERLVTISGTPECNQLALYMLYSRLESEKHRV